VQQSTTDLHPLREKTEMAAAPGSFDCCKPGLPDELNEGRPLLRGVSC